MPLKQISSIFFSQQLLYISFNSTQLLDKLIPYRSRGLPSGLLPSDFPVHALLTTLSSSLLKIWPSHLNFLLFIIVTRSGFVRKFLISLFVRFNSSLAVITDMTKYVTRYKLKKRIKRRVHISRNSSRIYSRNSFRIDSRNSSSTNSINSQTGLEFFLNQT